MHRRSASAPNEKGLCMALTALLGGRAGRVRRVDAVGWRGEGGTVHACACACLLAHARLKAEASDHHMRWPLVMSLAQQPAR